MLLQDCCVVHILDFLISSVKCIVVLDGSFFSVGLYFYPFFFSFFLFNQGLQISSMCV